ncbi:MAG TPA: alkaline phosphatase [bacterium]|nr:alkaline phosphatase [bacterium]
MTTIAVLFLVWTSTASINCSAYEGTSGDQSDLSFYKPNAVKTALERTRNTGVRNVILLIGDGMSLAPMVASQIKALGADGSLNIQKMPITGLSRTNSLDKLVTDSAAAGTALATGYKTRNGMIAALPDGKIPETILEAAKRKGLRTGLVATSTMSHATPASFAAHQDSRGSEAEISADMLATRVNVLFGGGLKFFLPASVEGSAREDERDLLREAREAGYTFLSNREEMLQADVDYALGLFQKGPLLTNDPSEPSLAEMTQKAIDLLRCKKGFFLMVEGSQIDWAGHENNFDYLARQTLLFDQAVGIALQFALQDHHTLVVVTADHDTGGLGINNGSLSGDTLELGWTTKSHTGVQVPVYAYGPGSEEFVGVRDNTEIPKVFARLLKIKDFPRLLR